jgi:hypothetical protein
MARRLQEFRPSPDFDGEVAFLVGDRLRTGNLSDTDPSNIAALTVTVQSPQSAFIAAKGIL